jgi:SAM-dependent methyltransferase
MDIINFGIVNNEIVARELFELTFPELDAKERLKHVPEGTRLSFATESFDIVISNTVLEHVRDHAFFFGELWRILKDRGSALHLYPSKEIFIELHIKAPFVHWIKDWQQRFKALCVLSRLGLTNYRSTNRNAPVSVNDWSEYYADFLTNFVNYKTEREMLKICEDSGLRSSFWMTEYFLYQFLFRFYNKSVPLSYLRLKGRQLPFVRYLVTRLTCSTLYQTKIANLSPRNGIKRHS